MTRTEKTDAFQTADGLALFTKRWTVAPSRGVVALVHGYAEHSGRYAHVADALNKAGFSLMSYDWRGHGRSEGLPGYVDRFAQYIDDLDRFLAHIKPEVGQTPLFLMGHSAGGLTAALYMREHQPRLAGLILSSPALKVSEDVSPLLQKVAGLIGAVLPKMKTVKLDSSMVSRDPAVVAYHQTHPLMYREGTRARTGAEIIQATQRMRQQFDQLQVPLYIFHGTADRLIDPAGSTQLYAEAAATDKTLKLYEGFYHETLNEPEKADVLADLVDWLLAHTPA